MKPSEEHIHKTPSLVGLIIGVGIIALLLAMTVTREAVSKEVELTNPDRQVFDAFRDWLREYEREPSLANIEEGTRLAVERRKILRSLFVDQPRVALENSITRSQYLRLPDSVRRETEEPYSGYGDYSVYIVEDPNQELAESPPPRLEREIAFIGRKLKAMVFSWREGMMSKVQTPLRGIIIGDSMLVDENSLRILKADEYPEYGVDYGRLSAEPVVAEVGGELAYFRSVDEAENLQNLITSKALRIGSKPGLEDGESVSPWTEGVKRVLMIRVDFADQPGDPIDSMGALTLARAQQSMQQVNSFYVNNSLGKTSLSTTITSVLRMPENRSYYVTNGDGPLTTHAFEAAAAAGYNPTSFDRIMYTFSAIPSSSTRAILGGTWSIFNGSFSLYALTHELGHNYGLLHAGGWLTSNSTVIGPGINLQYGNLFDMMGSGGESTGYHFNTLYKRQLDWLSADSIKTVTANGIYRITAQDSTVAGGVRALRIRKNGAKNYLVEFRQLLTQYPGVINGAVVMWDYASSPYRQTQLLDMTPQTSGNFADSPLLIGQNFLDEEDKVRLTVIGKGNTVPETLDVQVELNVGCTFSFQQTNQNIPPNGGEGNFSIVTQTGCYPYPVSSVSWLVPTFVESGSGTVIQHYIASGNFGSLPRTGTLTMPGQTLEVTQGSITTSCVTPPPNLAAWWRGEGGARDERGVNHGQLINEVTFGGGKVGGGFKFDGGAFGPPTQKVYIPDAPAFATSQSMTIEGWVKINQYPSSNQFTILVRDSLLAVLPPYALFVTQQGNLFFNVEASPNIGTRQFITAVGPVVPLGQFVHIAATLNHETGDMRIYMNGSLVGQVTTALRPYADLPGSPGTFAIGIGDYPFNDNVPFNGIIDELAFYNRALQLGEIQAIYNAGVAASGATGKCLLNVYPPFDFDGDGKTDLGIFRPNVAEWWINRSSNGTTFATQFGASTDRIVPADYTGDGRSDIAVWRPSSGEWFVLRSEDFSYYSFPFGTNGDIPVAGDFDLDGKADSTVFRQSNATWFVRRSTDGGFTIQSFGANGDMPVIGDYDGDGRSDFAIYRPSVGQWWLNRSTAGVIAVSFGNSTDKAVQGDYTGDGKTDVAFWRPSTGEWFVLRSEDFSFYAFPFGTSTDTPAPGDYDGDGKFDATVFRSSNATWYSSRSTTGTLIQQFGANGDRPIANAFVP